MATFKPIFVIVPGGWHPSSCYEVLAAHLKSANFTTLIASLPSLNSAQPLTATCTKDAEAIRQVLLPLIDEGKEVVLVNHSYGGIPGSGAAHGLSKVSRSKAGKDGGIIGIVYITSFVVPEGVSLVNFGGGEHPPYVLRDQVRLLDPKFVMQSRLIVSLAFSWFLLRGFSECIFLPRRRKSNGSRNGAVSSAACYTCIRIGGSTIGVARIRFPRQTCILEMYRRQSSASVCTRHVHGEKWGQMAGKGYRCKPLSVCESSKGSD